MGECVSPATWAISSSLTQVTSALTLSSLPLCRVCSPQPGKTIPVLQAPESDASYNWGLFLICCREYMGTGTIPSPPLAFVPRTPFHALPTTVTRVALVLAWPDTLGTEDLTELTLPISSQQELRWALALWPSTSTLQLLWCRMIAQDPSASKLCDCYWESK